MRDSGFFSVCFKKFVVPKLLNNEAIVLLSLTEYCLILAKVA